MDPQLDTSEKSLCSLMHLVARFASLEGLNFFYFYQLENGTCKCIVEILGYLVIFLKLSPNYDQSNPQFNC